MKDVLIVGCGNIAGGYDEGRADDIVRTHAKAFSSHPGFRLAACVEPSPQRRADFMRIWSVAEGAGTLAELAHRHFAVACICGPTATHAEHLWQLLEMNVDLVFCEKPLTPDCDEATRIVAAYAARGRILAVNYLRRFDSAMAGLRNDIAGGRLGRLQSAVGFYTKGILNNGSHMVDLLHYLIGPLTPCRVDRAIIDYLPSDPTLDCTLTDANGALIRMVGLDRNAFTIFELDLIFEHERVRLLDSGFGMTRSRVIDAPRFDNYRVLSAPAAEQTQLDTAFAHAAEAILAQLNGGEPLTSLGETALAAQRVCARLVSMAREQGMIST